MPIPPASVRTVRAAEDSALSARVVRRVPLRYEAGADASLDRPAHVRAGSGLAWAGSRLFVVQDDANFVALVDPRDMHVESVLLPAGAGGRRLFDDTIGNKADKLDLEAATSVPQPDGTSLVLALGSGSTPRRESVVVLHGLEGRDVRGATATVHAAPAFYARLRAARAFAGSELNVEAAVYLGRMGSERLRLFNRGNGAPRDGGAPVSATCDVSWPALAAHLASPADTEAPAPFDIVQYELGAMGGLPLTFTDAAVAPSTERARRRIVMYSAAAEASPDATRDGPVAGCAVGVIVEGPEGIRARWTPLRDDSGRMFDGKVEGMTLWPDDAMRAWVVTDRDVPELPAELCEVVLEGPWLVA